MHNSLRIALAEIAEGKSNTTLGGYTLWYEKWKFVRPAFLGGTPHAVHTKDSPSLLGSH